MYKFSPGLGTPLKYNPCDGRVSTESTCNVASSPTKVKSNSALVANEKPVSSIAWSIVVFNVSEVSLAIASINPKVCSPTNNACPTVSCEVKVVFVPVTVAVLLHQLDNHIKLQLMTSKIDFYLTLQLVFFQFLGLGELEIPLEYHQLF